MTAALAMTAGLAMTATLAMTAAKFGRFLLGKMSKKIPRRLPLVTPRIFP